MRKITGAVHLVLIFLLGWSLQAGADARGDTAVTKILLSFDDGPAVEVTDLVLEELDRRGIKAVFFLLTGPEKYVPWIPWGKTHARAESEEGFQTAIKEVRSGHMIACHWGGAYGSQLKRHPPRLLEPAYDSTGDGVIDKLSEAGNALESDLIHCRDTLNAALEQAAAGEKDSDILQQQPGSLSYVRPPVWTYKSTDGTLDVRPTYRLLGWEMLLSDARLNDGAIPIQGLPVSHRMNTKIIQAVANGQPEVIVAMHDTNIRTARSLAGILDRLERRLEGKGFSQGVHWDYTRTISEVDDAIQGHLKRTDHD